MIKAEYKWFNGSLERFTDYKKQHVDPIPYGYKSICQRGFSNEKHRGQVSTRMRSLGLSRWREPQVWRQHFGQSGFERRQVAVVANHPQGFVIAGQQHVIEIRPELRGFGPTQATKSLFQDDPFQTCIAVYAFFSDWRYRPEIPGPVVIPTGPLPDLW